MKGINKIISLIAISVYLILNIVSAVFHLPIYASTNQRKAITLIILVCNALIYIFTKNRTINKILLYYWLCILIFNLVILGRLLFPFSFILNMLRRMYKSCDYLFMANFLFYAPGANSIFGATIPNDTIFLIIAAIIFIILYLIKIIRQNRSGVTNL